MNEPRIIASYLEPVISADLVNPDIRKEIADSLPIVTATLECIGSYAGICDVVSNDCVIASLPTILDACNVAAFCSSPDGGYGITKVVSSPMKTCTHDSFKDWRSYTPSK